MAKSCHYQNAHGKPYGIFENLVGFCNVKMTFPDTLDGQLQVQWHEMATLMC